MSNAQFKDKVVAITGGASGIGLAIGRKFAEEGAVIACWIWIERPLSSVS